MILGERELKVGKVVVTGIVEGGYRVSGEFADINAFIKVCCVPCRREKNWQHQILKRDGNKLFFIRCNMGTSCANLFNNDR